MPVMRYGSWTRKSGWRKARAAAGSPSPRRTSTWARTSLTPSSSASRLTSANGAGAMRQEPGSVTSASPGECTAPARRMRAAAGGLRDRGRRPARDVRSRAGRPRPRPPRRLRPRLPSARLVVRRVRAGVSGRRARFARGRRPGHGHRGLLARLARSRGDVGPSSSATTVAVLAGHHGRLLARDERHVLARRAPSRPRRPRRWPLPSRRRSPPRPPPSRRRPPPTGAGSAAGAGLAASASASRSRS